MKRHVKDIAQVILLAAAIAASLLAQAAQEAAKPVTPVVSPEKREAYYKQWGEFQSIIARFQQTLTSQQKALQEEIKAREDLVNKLAQGLVVDCGGNLDIKSLQEQNLIKCLPATVKTEDKKTKE